MRFEKLATIRVIGPEEKWIQNPNCHKFKYETCRFEASIDEIVTIKREDQQVEQPYIVVESNSKFFNESCKECVFFSEASACCAAPMNHICYSAMRLDGKMVHFEEYKPKN